MEASLTSAETTSTPLDKRDWAVVLLGERVRARMRKEGLERKRETTEPPWEPVAPITTIVLGVDIAGVARGGGYGVWLGVKLVLLTIEDCRLLDVVRMDDSGLLTFIPLKLLFHSRWYHLMQLRDVRKRWHSRRDCSVLWRRSRGDAVSSGNGRIDHRSPLCRIIGKRE